MSEQANNLRSKAFYRIVDLVAEGPIEGLVDGEKSIFLDGTPLRSEDNTLNFKNVVIDSRTGTNSQTYMAGFGGVESETLVSTEVTKVTPVVRTISGADVNAVRVTLSVPSLYQQSTSTGDIFGISVNYEIQVQPSGGSYTTQVNGTISGKTNSKYQKAHRVELTGTGPWNVRVVRITNDAATANIQNKTFWESYSTIIDNKFRYPNSAVVGVKIDAEQFSSVPSRAYDLKLLQVKIPSNYNPTTRVYTGVWDGTFNIAWTDNPAWVFYDLLTNTRYGLGNFIEDSQVDKWALYQVSRYCDDLVPDGFGGTEPRFTCNIYMQTRAEAYKVMQDLASVFRGMSYWASGAVTVSQDAPQDAAYLYTPANVIDGVFSYAGSSSKARHTVALVTWNDPDDFYKQKVEYVEDADGIVRYGVVQTEVVATGCTSQGQANRVGRWLLYTEQSESEVVTFKAGLEGAIASPGQVIKVADPTRAGTRRGGRIATATATAVTLDTVTTVTGVNQQLSVILPDGSVEQRTISLIAGAVVTVSPSFSTAPAAGSIWMITTDSLDAQLFRVVSVVEGEEGFDISALAYNPSKYDAIELGLELQTRDITQLNVTPAAPVSVTLTESLYTYQAEVRCKVSVSWPNVDGATSYLVQWSKDDANFETAETSANDYEILNTTPGVFVVDVFSVNAIGTQSVNPVSGTITAIGKTAPPANVTGFDAVIDPNIGVTLIWDRIADLDLDSYEVREGAIWNTATPLGQVKGTSLKLGLIQEAATTYLIKALDTSGNYSTNEASRVVDLAVAAAPTVAGSFAGENIVLTWGAVTGDLATDAYAIRYGASFAAGTSLGTIKGTSFATRAQWSGSRTFWIAAVDLAGNFGAAGSFVATITAPSAITVTQEVIDNNVLLKWGDATQTLPIEYYELRKGATYASASVIGRISSRFSAIFESSGGTFTYWVNGVDVAGNTGTPSSVTALVNQPPDYQLQFDQNSTFAGTKSGFFQDSSGQYVTPVDTTETWESHFTSRSWASPQAQVTAGFDRYIMPAAASGSYEETIDYGTVLAATKITTTLTYSTVAGTVTVTPQISVRKLITDPWTDYAGLSSVFVTDFRYVKVSYTFTQTGGANIVSVTGLNVRFDVKLKNDAGTVAAVSTDSGGTTVPFTVSFVDVQSITLSPAGTAARIAVYDFVDVPNPTSFKVLLFDTSGTRVSGNVGWSVKGI
jgi:predicted phage tail protein